MTTTGNILSARRARRVTAAVAAVAATALALAGCSGGGDEESAETENVLTLVAATPPTSLNPALANADSVGSWYNQLPYEPLIRLAPDGSLEPGIAESWQFLDDSSTEFELTIRDGVTFADGTELTPEAVADTLNYYVADASNGAAWLGGADTTVEATGDNTVVMHLGTPNSTLPGYLTQRTLLGSVISPAGLEDPESLKSATFGAGPYVLDTEQTVAESSYVYVPNENYWDQDSIEFDQVVIQVSGSNSASYQAIETGDADLMRGDLSTATSAKAAGLTVVTAPTSLLGIAYVDREGAVVPELADVRVRQALSYAIDRESIVQAAWGEDGLAGNALTLPEYVGFTDEISDAYAYDPEKAKELLADAGLADGFSFTIGAWNLAPADAVVQAVVANWQAIGVNATIEFYSDAGQLANDALAKKFGVISYYYGAGRTSMMMNDFLSGSPTQYNPFGTTNEDVVAALATASTSPDEGIQQDAFAEAMQIALVDEAWVTNIAYTPSFIIASDRVTNLEFGSSLSAPDISHLVAPAGD
jgi:peptide/nickel transport system substrate-binding protein